jgi:hypothetical protein
MQFPEVCAKVLIQALEQRATGEHLLAQPGVGFEDSFDGWLVEIRLASPRRVRGAPRLPPGIAVLATHEGTSACSRAHQSVVRRAAQEMDRAGPATTGHRGRPRARLTPIRRRPPGPHARHVAQPENTPRARHVAVNVRSPPRRNTGVLVNAGTARPPQPRQLCSHGHSAGRPAHARGAQITAIWCHARQAVTECVVRRLGSDESGQ